MDGERSKPLTKLPLFRGVQAYACNDDHGRATRISAIDEDDGKIRAIADILQRAGYGVLRERNPRAGRIFHRLNATWAGTGEPPENPLTAG